MSTEINLVEINIDPMPTGINNRMSTEINNQMSTGVNLDLLRFIYPRNVISMIAVDLYGVLTSTDALQVDLKKLTNDLILAERLYRQSEECYKRFIGSLNGIVELPTDEVERQLHAGNGSTVALSWYCKMVREDSEMAKEHHDAFMTIYRECETLCFNSINAACKLAQTAERKGMVLGATNVIGCMGVTLAAYAAVRQTNYLHAVLGAGGVAIAVGSHFYASAAATLCHKLQSNATDLDRQFHDCRRAMHDMESDIAAMYSALCDLESQIRRIQILPEDCGAAEVIREQYERANRAKQRLQVKPLRQQLPNALEEGIANN